MSQNRFVFISPMFNASKTLARMLHSIAGQSYENWRVVLIDDLSDDNDQRLNIKTIDSFNRLVGFGKIETIWNINKKWETANVLAGINKFCDDDDIICRIDADDWLVDLDALAILDQTYNNAKCDVCWSMHRWGFSDRNISAALPRNADVYRHDWVSSHLKTWRKRLMNNICDVNYRGEDGEYIKRCGDQAIYLPVMHNAQNRVFLPRVLYHYSIEDDPRIFHTDDAKFQKSEAEFLRKRGYIECH